MKICPKCRSTFTDETLNFCLSDGETLVVSEVYNSTDFVYSEDQTIADANFQIPHTLHQTNPNSTSPTVNISRHFSQIIPAQPKKNIILPILLLSILGIGTAVGGYFYFKQDKLVNSTTKEISQPTNRQVANLSGEQQSKINSEITDFLESWRVAIEKKDMDSHIKHYSNSIEVFYKDGGVDRNFVKAIRQKALDNYDILEIKIDNLKISAESNESVFTIFDKSWTFKNSVKTTTGQVQQELHIAKTDGKWQIVGEKDLKVYFINNRENSNSNQ
jgi:ketosteroid isomerase-like protein